MPAAQSERIRAIDLFCGAGGSSWGAVAAGVDVVAAFDMSALAGQCHKDNIPGASFHLGKLEECNVKEMKRGLGRVDLILASPECTSHSPARGSKKKSESSRDTAFQIPRFARALLPRWIIIENVVGMRRWGRYAELKRQLTNLGYHIREQVLDAAAFGVPQRRKRLFLLCDLCAVPQQTNGTAAKATNIKSIIRLDAPYKWSPLRKKGRAKATLERARRGIERVGLSEPFLIVYYGSDGAGGWQTMSRPLRTITTVDRFAIVQPTSEGHSMRMLQVPELQRAMGMEGMQFNHGTRRDKIKLLGNAVCPPVMRAVIEQLVG
ncbi:MAG: putative BsuMI modification methylase subunit YdiO [Gemmatimonadetes bacterium]|nr:putative BsuMI modification methylase subunit YdiO [Gemmatimonadota bacterium]